MGVKRQWGCRERQFSTFSLAIFSDTFGDEASVIIWRYAVCRQLFSDLMTLNDLDWLFRVAPVWLADTARLRKIIA